LVSTRRLVPRITDPPYRIPLAERGTIAGASRRHRHRIGDPMPCSRGHPVYVVTDEAADRMRIIVQIAPASQLTQEDLYRMMQANFDTALDARYAIAREVLWAAFIHPLSPLTDDAFRAGFQQAVTLAETYGTSYSSGGLRFQGGDTPQ
jgi:hypothetical protein